MAHAADAPAQGSAVCPATVPIRSLIVLLKDPRRHPRRKRGGGWGSPALNITSRPEFCCPVAHDKVCALQERSLLPTPIPHRGRPPTRCWAAAPVPRERHHCFSFSRRPSPLELLGSQTTVLLTVPEAGRPRSGCLRAGCGPLLGSLPMAFQGVLMWRQAGSTVGSLS